MKFLKKLPFEDYNFFLSISFTKIYQIMSATYYFLTHLFRCVDTTSIHNKYLSKTESSIAASFANTELL